MASLCFPRLKEVFLNDGLTDGTGGNKILEYEYDNQLGFITKKRLYDNENSCTQLVETVEYDKLSNPQNRLKTINSATSGLFKWDLFYDNEAAASSTSLTPAPHSYNFN